FRDRLTRAHVEKGRARRGWRRPLPRHASPTRRDQPLMHSPMKALRLAPRSDCSVAARLQAFWRALSSLESFGAASAAGTTVAGAGALATGTAGAACAGTAAAAGAATAPGTLAAEPSCLPCRQVP